MPIDVSKRFHDPNTNTMTIPHHASSLPTHQQHEWRPGPREGDIVEGVDDKISPQGMPIDVSGTLYGLNSVTTIPHHDPSTHQQHHSRPGPREGHVAEGVDRVERAGGSVPVIPPHVIVRGPPPEHHPDGPRGARTARDTTDGVTQRLWNRGGKGAGGGERGEGEGGGG
jgi:hypothetical protein